MTTPLSGEGQQRPGSPRSDPPDSPSVESAFWIVIRAVSSLCAAAVTSFRKSTMSIISHARVLALDRATDWTPSPAEIVEAAKRGSCADYTGLRGSTIAIGQCSAIFSGVLKSKLTMNGLWICVPRGMNFGIEFEW
jgi:hypothetical protein